MSNNFIGYHPWNLFAQAKRPERLYYNNVEEAIAHGAPRSFKNFLNRRREQNGSVEVHWKLEIALFNDEDTTRPKGARMYVPFSITDFDYLMSDDKIFSGIVELIWLLISTGRANTAVRTAFFISPDAGTTMTVGLHIVNKERDKISCTIGRPTNRPGVESRPAKEKAAKKARDSNVRNVSQPNRAAPEQEVPRNVIPNQAALARVQRAAREVQALLERENRRPILELPHPIRVSGSQSSDDAPQQRFDDRESPSYEPVTISDTYEAAPLESATIVPDHLIEHESRTTSDPVPATPAIDLSNVPSFDLSAEFKHQTANIQSAIEEEDNHYQRRRETVQERYDLLQHQLNATKRELDAMDLDHDIKRARLCEKLTKSAEKLRKKYEEKLAQQWAMLMSSIPK